MRFIRESRRCDVRSFVYGVDDNFEEVVSWINNIVAEEVIATDVITLRDTRHSYDEGNQSVQLECPFDKEQLLEKIRLKEIDKISFSGKYKSDSVSVCYNLQTSTIAFSFVERSSISRDTLEGDLRLV